MNRCPHLLLPLSLLLLLAGPLAGQEPSPPPAPPVLLAPLAPTPPQLAVPPATPGLPSWPTSSGEFFTPAPPALPVAAPGGELFTPAIPPAPVSPPPSSAGAAPDAPAFSLFSGGEALPEPLAPASTLRTSSEIAGDARLAHPDSTVVSYGQETPRLRCAPLRACVVELEEGETIYATVSGDTERWTIARVAAGPRGRTPLLAIKPTACDLATNLVVLTDRRIYLLDLQAPACPGGDPERPGQAFTPLLRFSYPRLVDWQADPASLAAASAAASAFALAAPIPVERLNFHYRWERRGRFPWTPEAIFDDGVHTYIRLPARTRQDATPVLFLLGERGATELLNYSYRPGVDTAYYVTDRVVDRAVLVLGAGRGQRRLTLINEARVPGRP